MAAAHRCAISRDGARSLDRSINQSINLSIYLSVGRVIHQTTRSHDYAHHSIPFLSGGPLSITIQVVLMIPSSESVRAGVYLSIYQSIYLCFFRIQPWSRQVGLRGFCGLVFFFSSSSPFFPFPSTLSIIDPESAP